MRVLQSLPRRSEIQSQAGIGRSRRNNRRFPLAATYTPRPTVYFCDLLINGDSRKLEQLCDQLIEARLDIEWLAYARFSPDLTPRMLQ